MDKTRSSFESAERSCILVGITTMVERKPSLSPSKITTYLACAAKYKWTYADHRGRWFMRSKSYFSFGSSLHKVLERFHDSGDMGVQTTAEAAAALDESWIEAGYSNAQEMQEALGEGKRIVAAYVQHEVARSKDATTLFVEKLFRMDMGDFDLIGRMDRVDEYSDGTLEVVDYKTQRASVSDEAVRDDLAMGCYQILLRDAFPGRPVRAAILALQSGERGVASFTDLEAEEFKNDLVELGGTILNRDYEGLTPVYRDLCPTCDFLRLCRTHEDFVIPASAEPESV